MYAKRRTSSKSGLTLLLEELTTLLPKALEACPADSESQSSSLVIEKLRSVLLDLLDNCLKCSSGQGRRCQQQHAQHASLQPLVAAAMIEQSLLKPEPELPSWPSHCTKLDPPPSIDTQQRQTHEHLI
jgi:hypothetical protein